MALQERFHQPKFCLNTCNQSRKSCNSSLRNSSRPSFCLFAVSVGLWSGFPRSSSLTLPLLSAAGFSVPITESCVEDVEEEGVDDVEELVDKPGKKNGT